MTGPRRNPWDRWVLVPAVACALLGMAIVAGGARAEDPSGPTGWLNEERDGTFSLSILAEEWDPEDVHDLAMRVCRSLASSVGYLVGPGNVVVSQRCLRIAADNPDGYELRRGPDTLEATAFQRGIAGPGVPTEAEWWVLHEATDGQWGIAYPDGEWRVLGADGEWRVLE